MNIEDTIVLDDNQKYTLLQKVIENNNTYFLAVGLGKDDKPDVTNMVILKECIDTDGIYVETVANETLIAKLTKEFEKKMKEDDK